MNLDYDSRVINGISIYATDNYLRDGIVRVNRDTEVEQTFKATRSFNYIRGYISSYDEKNNSKYKVEIIDKKLIKQLESMNLYIVNYIGKFLFNLYITLVL